MHGQKMIDPPVWQSRISPRIFLKIQHVHGQKMIDPPWMTDQDLTRPGSYLEFFLKIQHVHGSVIWGGGGQSYFDHGHVESLKRILGGILVCHTRGVNHLLTMDMLNF